LYRERDEDKEEEGRRREEKSAKSKKHGVGHMKKRVNNCYARRGKFNYI